MKRGFLVFGVFIIIFTLVYGSIAGVFTLFSSRTNSTFDISAVMEGKRNIDIPQKWLDKYSIVAKNDIDIKN